MTLRRGFLALPLLAYTARAEAQKLQMPITWYGVQVEDNIFTVQMPGVPDHRIVNDVTARGAAFRLHSYSLDAGGASYVAQSATYPGDVDADPRAILQATIDGRAKSLDGGKWSRVDWRQVQGANAVESSFALRSASADSSLRVCAANSPRESIPAARLSFASSRVNVP